MTQAYAMQYAKTNASTRQEKRVTVTGEKTEPDLILFLFVVVFYTYTTFLLIRGLRKIG